VAPWPLILGVAAGFLGCCLAGRLVSHRNPFGDFERFHQMIAPESLFYPTACQVRELARSRFDPAKVAVLISGSSVLHGTCQQADQVWTRRLQALLGDRYQVLNLAMRCGRPTEIGAVAAEFLAREYPRLILITDTCPGRLHPDPDGCRFRYFFWDAYYKGLLLPDKAREERLGEVIAEAEQGEMVMGRAVVQELSMPAEAQREVRTQMALDGVLYFGDLWNTIACTRFHTVWTSLAHDACTRPRSQWPDNDPGAKPLPIRYARDNDFRMGQVRAHLVGQCVKDARQEWVEDSSSGVWPALERAAATSFPEPARERTLFLVLWYSPHYLRQLTADELACYAAASRCTVARLAKLGFAALETGADCEPVDYADIVHFTESGGAKLAEAVAPAVRAMAGRLGYLNGADGH
jgi:hypothetical protein